ncbi:MAG: SurA N-terminal domain-containing protein [Endomicrobium sp.]|nr:SurA N-terminal domain-containing protein [Endomicrobium sp.]
MDEIEETFFNFFCQFTTLSGFPLASFAGYSLKINNGAQNKMMNFFRRHIRIIFVITIVAFALGTFLSGGYYFFGPKDYVAKINGTKISVRRFQLLYENLVKMYTQMTNSQLSEQNLDFIKTLAIQRLIRDEIYYQQAKIYGIVVTDEELRTDIQNSDMFKDNNVFSKVEFAACLTSMKMSPKEYESLRKEQIASSKLINMLTSSVKIWEHELKEAVKQDSSVTRNILRQTKAANVIISGWYLPIFNNSKIVRNDFIFK